MLERIDKEQSVDVFNYLRYMRTRRVNMVQTFVSCFISLMPFVILPMKSVFDYLRYMRARRVNMVQTFVSCFISLMREVTYQ